MKKNNENLKRTFITFDLGKPEDKDLYKRIEEVTHKINYGKQRKEDYILKSDIVKKMIKLPTDDEIIEMKRPELSMEERTHLWMNGYNEEHKTTYNIYEFLVSCVSSLKAKDKERYEKEGLVAILNKKISEETTPQEVLNDSERI